MQRSAQITLVVALLGLGATLGIQSLMAREAVAQDELPLSTRLTPAMVDFFGLEAAYARPSFAALTQCAATPACGASDSSRVRFLDSTGGVMSAFDATRTASIEQVRRSTRADSTGERTTTTITVRRYAHDTQGRLVMHGTDTVAIRRTASTAVPASVTTHVRRYSDVRYLENSQRFAWPITGMVVLEVAMAEPLSAHLGQHAAVSFDGSARARIITTNGLTHRADLQQKVLETEMPTR